MSTERDILQRIQKLRKLIAYHRSLYHTFDAPELSDAAFDTLKNELEELERKHPQFSSKHSPTQTVGGKPLEKFVKVKHEAPMLSLTDAFSQDEMREWNERVEKYLGRAIPPGSVPPYYCELKIDGLAIELIYEKGKLVTAATRGDGLIGEDVTQNVGTIPSIPQELAKLGAWDVPDHAVIRGEIFITTKELARINREQEEKGLHSYANSRNLAAGSIRQLDPSIAAARKLESFQYEIVAGAPKGIKTHEEKHKLLASWGCSVNPHNRTARSLEDVYAFRDAWEKKREKLEYEIDGIVVLLNDNALFDQAGTIGKAPRGGIAYKFSPKEATTIIESVSFQVGRSGVITPVAELRPVEVSGVTISHATLHNFDEIGRLGVRIGDTVVVTRSGDVIPKIVSVIPELRTGKEKDIRPPKSCPVDHSSVVRDGVFLRCSNPKCGARNRNQIAHFVSRGALDMRGFGRKIIDRFIDEGLISHAGDIFFLKEGDIAALERFGEKSAHNLMQEIERARTVDLKRFLYAIGIGHVGEETAELLARSIASRLPKKKQASVSEIVSIMKSFSADDLQKLPDIGPKVAHSIHDWFFAEENKELLSALEKADLHILLPGSEKKTGVFSGMRIAVTGTLSSMSRQRAKEQIELHGGHFDGSITNETDAVVIGENPGSKAQQAKKRGIPIWTEDEFIARMES